MYRHLHIPSLLGNVAIFLPALPTVLLQMWREKEVVATDIPPGEPLRVEGWSRESPTRLHLRCNEGRELGVEVFEGGVHIWSGVASTGSDPVSAQQKHGSSPPESPMVASLPGPLEAQVEEAGGELHLNAGGREIRVGLDPLSLSVEGSRFSLSCPPAGWSLEWPLGEGEHLYGTGERFSGFGLRGQRFAGWAVDALGNNSERSYKPVPWLASTRRYGLFLHTPHRVVWDLGHDNPGEARVHTPDPQLDLYLFTGTLAELLGGYTRVTGRAPVPPLWSFGVWMSRCMYPSRRRVEAITRRLRAEGVGCDVVSLDPLWLKGRRRLLKDACIFEWNTHAFPRPGEMVAQLRSQGLRVCLWVNPYVPKRSQMGREGVEKGYFPVRGVGGGPVDGESRPASPRGQRVGPLPPATACDNPAIPVDFSNPEAARWVQEKLKPLLDMGVATFKTDYGEGAPARAAYRGGDGLAIHNLYPLLYNRAFYEAVEKHDGQGLVWARSGTSGSQRYPVHWSGDSRSTWEHMAGVLRGGLNLALSGYQFWSHDIGGFFGIPTPELYTRWAQWGLLVSHARFHGTTPREPWAFGPQPLEIVPEHIRFRYRLLPYLWAEAHRSSRTGLPMFRPMVLEFQEDLETHTLDDQYLLGPHLLVAPLLQPGGHRRVYLPGPLPWLDLHTGTPAGPGWIDVDVPLESIPLYLRPGTLLPLGPPMVHTGERPWNPLTIETYLPGPMGHAELRIPGEPGETRLTAHREARALHLQARGGPPREIVWRIRDTEPPKNVEWVGPGAARLTWNYNGPERTLEAHLHTEGEAGIAVRW